MTYDSTVLSSSPVAYWLLNETSGTSLADATGNGHTATLAGSGSTRTVDPFLGANKALDFGSSGYVDTGYTPSGWGALTYECLVLVASPAAQVIAASRNGATPGVLLGLNRGISTPGAGKLVAGWDKSGVWVGRKATGSAIPAARWVHVACTWQGGSAISASQFKVYLNGTQVDTASDTYSSDASTSLTSSVLYLANGKDTASVGGMAMSRFALYNTALSGATISAHAAAYAAAVPPDAFIAGVGESGAFDLVAFERGGSSAPAVPTTGQIWPRGNWG